MSALLLPLLGGALIGVSAAMLLLFNGKIAGISGIVGGFFSAERSDLGWRSFFLVGLLGGGALLSLWWPSALHPVSDRSWPVLIAAGLLVGAGSRVGNGCTSGHGVCGIGHLRLRSLVATLTFIAFGMLTVFLSHSLQGGRS